MSLIGNLILKRVTSMNFKITLLKALRGAGAVILAALVAVLTDANFAAQLANIADALAAAIPFVGGAAKGVILTAISAGVAAGVAALRNILKHWNDEPQA